MTEYNSQSSPVQSSPVQSIIIPTYNRKEFIADAINSVLSQTQKSLEVIVVDDCSTDGTADFVKSIADERVHYLRNEKNSGLEFNRMIGLRQARGKYITFLDDDDYYTDYEFFAKAVSIHEEHEAAGDPLVMVYANAQLVDTRTGKASLWKIGKPGRVKGLDFVLGREGYSKPPSTFPTVFRTETLRRAGLENKIIFDTMTYIEAALYGDAWLLPDIIGVYTVHGESYTLGYKKPNPELEERYYQTASENIRRWKHVAEVVRERTDKRTADKLFISRALGLANYCGIARPKFADRLRAYGCVLRESGFMPKLWLMFTIYWLKSALRKITPLRKLYRFIKYRLRGRPYPEN